MMTQSRYLRVAATIGAIALVVGLLFGGCSNTSLLGAGRIGAGRTTILFWYDWHGADEQLLRQLLDNFRQLQPDIQVIAEPAPDDLADDFAGRFDQGLEPDLVLAGTTAAQALIRTGYVRDLTPYGLSTRGFSPAALSTLRSGQALYGLPFALSTQLLFYSKDKVPTPPATLSELIEVTAQPAVVMGLNTNFASAFWGIGAFGGRAYNADGTVTVDRGALTNWLSALVKIQNAAGFSLSADQQRLREQFLAGKTALYVDDSWQSSVLAAKLGDKLGIAPLPQGDSGSASSPLLNVAGLLISNNTGDAETQAALKLMQFLTNSQQQSLLEVADIGQLAATNWAPVSANMPPVVVALSQQIGSAVPITLAQRPLWDDLTARGQTLYRSVLEGLIDEQEGAGQLEQHFQALLQSDPEVNQSATSAAACPVQVARPLHLALWHDWTAAETQVLATLLAEFHARCPQVTVTTRVFDSDVDLDADYRTAVEQGNPPDILLSYSTYIGLLAADGLVRSLNNDVTAVELSTFVPSAVEALRYGGRLYGYPESVSGVALIYNPKLAPEPPRTLDALKLQVDGDHQFAMPPTFYDAYWGLGAFNAQVLAADNRCALDSPEAAKWLEWLHAAANRPGFTFTKTLDEAQDLFIERRAAYLVSGPWALERLRAALPDDEIAVTTLPAGPANLAAPLVDVAGFVFPPSATDATVEAGLALARHISSRASEQKLLATGMHVPANITVDVSSAPTVNGFLDQAQWAQGSVQSQQWKTLFAQGDALYQQVVEQGDDAPAALKQFCAQVDATVVH